MGDLRAGQQCGTLRWKGGVANKMLGREGRGKNIR